jgi:hypothetical protein
VYFQLISAVDRFIAYDDVTYIKQGWINRNRILANSSPLLFSIPLRGASSNSLIREVDINTALYEVWKIKFMKTVEQYYRKAPCYSLVLPIINAILTGEPQRISILAIRSIKLICNYLGISTDIVESASHYGNSHLKGEARVIDICQREHAQVYVNSIGGQELYSRENFRERGICLKFLQPKDIAYKQFKHSFVPWLSIIDVLMFNMPETISTLVQQYELI